MRAVMIAGALVALTACDQQAPSTPAAEMASVGCESHARAAWEAAPGQRFSITASADGPTCQNAVATLTIRDPAGKVLMAEAYPVEFVMNLREKKTDTELDAALAEWIDPAKSTPSNTKDLIAWPAGQTHPPGEFPFYPEDDVDQKIYESYRTKAQPVLCYVQGGESMACVLWDTDRLVRLGVQTFPG
jgi:hypothetical protein